MNKLFYVSKVIFFNFFLLFFVLFLFEIFLNIKNNTLLKKNKFNYREELKKEYESVDVAYAPYKLLNKDYSLIPLNGISNTKTILCKHNDSFVTYQSDKYGFNNFKLSIQNDIIILGDSYVHGLCLKKENTLVNNIYQSGINVINFGMMSTGPLIQYATLKEYSEEYNYNSIVWLFNPDNDFYDFSVEITDPILKKYFFSDKYNQDLINNNYLKNKILLEYFDYEGRKIKELVKFYHLDLKRIRDIIQIFIDRYIYKKNHYSDISYVEKNNLNKIINTINKTIEFTGKNKKNLIFIINAVRPEVVFSKNKNIIKLNDAYLNNIKKIKIFLQEKEIKYFDYNKFVYETYDESTINDIFKITDNGYDHFTPKGNNILATKISDLILNNNKK